jgi:hypothetical protein
MQTKSSYGVLKWTFILGAMATLGSACVITSGDGDTDGEGGEGGSIAEAGKTSTAGKGGSVSTAGKTGGGTGGTGGTGGATTPSAGAGGEGETYMAGLCDADEPDLSKGILPSKFPSCAPAANDEGQDCKKCLKDKCCEAWQNCYGSEPHIACGWGPVDSDEDNGQWGCLQNCFLQNASNAADPDELLETCSGECTNQCDADGGAILIATSDLIACANDATACQTECFPF